MFTKLHYLIIFELFLVCKENKTMQNLILKTKMFENIQNWLNTIQESLYKLPLLILFINCQNKWIHRRERCSIYPTKVWRLPRSINNLKMFWNQLTAQPPEHSLVAAASFPFIIMISIIHEEQHFEGTSLMSICHKTEMNHPAGIIKETCDQHDSSNHCRFSRSQSITQYWVGNKDSIHWLHFFFLSRDQTSVISDNMSSKNPVLKCVARAVNAMWFVILLFSDVTNIRISSYVNKYRILTIIVKRHKIIAVEKYNFYFLKFVL